MPRGGRREGSGRKKKEIEIEYESVRFEKGLKKDLKKCPGKTYSYKLKHLIKFYEDNNK